METDTRALLVELDKCLGAKQLRIAIAFVKPMPVVSYLVANFLFRRAIFDPFAR